MTDADAVIDIVNTHKLMNFFCYYTLFSDLDVALFTLTI